MMRFSFARRCNFARERAGRHLPLSSSINSVRPVTFPPARCETADEANTLRVGDGRDGGACGPLLPSWPASLDNHHVSTFRRTSSCAKPGNCFAATVARRGSIFDVPPPGRAHADGKLPSSPATVCVGVSRNPLPSRHRWLLCLNAKRQTGFCPSSSQPMNSRRFIRSTRRLRLGLRPGYRCGTQCWDKRCYATSGRSSGLQWVTLGRGAAMASTARTNSARKPTMDQRVTPLLIAI